MPFLVERNGTLFQENLSSSEWRGTRYFVTLFKLCLECDVCQFKRSFFNSRHEKQDML